MQSQYFLQKWQFMNKLETKNKFVQAETEMRNFKSEYYLS